jgi:TPP-dependent pyruvate/acetoin dehydrogenase alpha subunit
MIATARAKAAESGETVLDLDLLGSLYSRMVLIRTVEQSLLDLFSRGKLRGTVHTCLGQEAIAVGVVSVLNATCDAVCSNHRGHGHYLAYRDDVRGLVAEIMGRTEGVCGGVGGSQHLHSGHFYSNGILGGMAPVAAGLALARKLRKSEAVAVVFHGDGAMAEGAIAETFNIAALWRLPLLFVVERNQYAQSTPIGREIAGDLARRGEPFGVATHVVDGNDVIAVRGAATAALRRLRRSDGPALLLCDTYRLGPHSKGDDDRDPAEIEAHRRNDPLLRAELHLDPGWCAAEKERIAVDVRGIVEGLAAC